MCLWLQAPAGFGKSVLAGQMAASLSLRVLWASALFGAPKDQLARSLNLAADTPWGVLLESIRAEPTLLVLEDLTGQEELSPLLRALPALVVLASRKALSYPELPKLLAEGRLVHLTAEDLAFTLDEAKVLFGGRPGAEEAHRATGGWPLPLFLAAITGEPPQAPALLQGLKESLEPEEFEEGLLLAALPYLPAEQATPATQSLFQKGLLRSLPQGYRLHDLLREMARQSLPEEVRQAVRRGGGRLSLELLAEAYFACDLHAELLELLEQPFQLKLLPETLVGWKDILIQGGPRARLRLGEALLQCGRKGGLELLEPLAEHPEPDLALFALGHLTYYLADPLLGQNLAAARAYLEKGLTRMEQASPEVAGRFLNDAARLPWEEGHPEESMRLLEEALRRLPPESPYRVAPLVNLAFLRFELLGDLLGRIRALEEGVPLALRYSPMNHPGHLRDLGRLYLLLGEREKALAYLEEAARSPGHPLAALEARMLLAYLRGDEEGLFGLLAQAELWESAYLVGRGRALLSLLRRDAGLLEGVEGFWAGLARAELRGDPAGLPPYPAEREERLYWHATRYRLVRDAADLQALLGLTQAGERVLPGLIPIGLLPQERPELARFYPLREVLQSGWVEAVTLRLPELPPLEVEVLGRFRVLGPLGEVVLAGKLREVFVLLLLGLSREEAAFTLWTDLSEEAALRNLSVWLFRLRKLLEPWGRPTYLLETGFGRVQADLFALEAALAREDPGVVLALYRLPLFPGVDLPPVDRKREELYHRVRALFLAQKESRYLERLLELDPLDEEALVLWVRECLARGQRTRARRALEVYRKRLRDELGEEPSAEVKALLRTLA